jgi:hypothetical protein
MRAPRTSSHIGAHNSIDSGSANELIAGGIGSILRLRTRAAKLI